MSFHLATLFELKNQLLYNRAQKVRFKIFIHLFLVLLYFQANQDFLDGIKETLLFRIRCKLLWNGNEF